MQNTQKLNIISLLTKKNLRRSESGSNYHAGHRRNESMYAMTGLYAESGVGSGGDPADGQDSSPGEQLASSSGRLTHDTVIRCHSRNPSSGLVDHRYTHSSSFLFLLSHVYNGIVHIRITECVSLTLFERKEVLYIVVALACRKKSRI